MVLNIPGHPLSIHICLYLPTSGRNTEYLEELARLEKTIDDLDSQYPDATIYLRGDANASMIARPGSKRDELFKYFFDKLSLVSTPINEHTYHHFVGEGKSDSTIDVILQRNCSMILPQETILKVLCSKKESDVDSKHDIIISSFILPFTGYSENTQENNLIAPQITNTKHKINWNEDSIPHYQELLSPVLQNLQQNWDNPLTSVSFSHLLSCTNEALAAAAKATNKSIDLSKESKIKEVKVPLEITAAANTRKLAHKELKNVLTNNNSTELEKASARKEFNDTKKVHRRLSRQQTATVEITNEAKLNQMMTSNPQAALKHISSLKSSSASSKISELKVGDKTYYGDNVGNGFFDSIKQLKTMEASVQSCEKCEEFRFDYNIIRELCKSGSKIPPLDLEASEKLLHSLRPSVCDHWSISASHYINGGPHAINHFMFLLNAAIENVELSSCDELNIAHAQILYKGHKKDKNMSSSYRTISTCPFLAKSLDTYVRSLSINEWETAQSDVQFLGSGKSHELGALLLTEVIQHNININNKPVFSLFLDARSAYDKTIREIMVRNLFLLDTDGSRLIYLDNRLKNRKTFCEWDRKVMGPILDEQGVEQGGVPSSDLYGTYNNEQLDSAQESGLGLHYHDIHIAAVGQADDVVLVSAQWNPCKYISFRSFQCKNE